MAEPRHSVIVPARNEEAFIGEALESVAGQSWSPDEIEVIVVSNGSSDGTAEVARGAARQLGLTVSVVELVAPGVARAKNVGAAAARGPSLVFLDADSRMSPGLLSRITGRTAAGERAATIRVVADGQDPIDHGFFWVIENGKRLVRIRANMFWCERAVFEQLGGFDERLNQAEDLDFLVRARRAGIRVGHIRDEWIATSARRLHRGPLRIGMVRMFGRWMLGQVGIGREWPY